MQIWTGPFFIAGAACAARGDVGTRSGAIVGWKCLAAIEPLQVCARDPWVNRLLGVDFDDKAGRQVQMGMTRAHVKTLAERRA